MLLTINHWFFLFNRKSQKVYFLGFSEKGEIKMGNGIIGIFSTGKLDENKYSVSVRKDQTKEELESQFKSEHKNADVFLLKAYSFKSNDNISDVEKTLRKLLVQKFGPYQPENHWEFYSNSEANEFVNFIVMILNLSQNTTDIREL